MSSTIPDGLRIKIERAKLHIQELNAIAGAFKQSNPYAIATKRDPNTRQLIYYVASVQPVPLHISIVAGEVINGLRSVLEHVAHQMIVANGQVPTKNSGFPIFDDAVKYETQRIGKVKGMRQDAIDAIDRIEPYKGGKGHLLWVLHELNNIDKHRLLLAVAASLRGVDLGAFTASLMQVAFPDRVPVEAIAKHSAFFGPADALCPLKTGDEVFIDRPEAEPNEHLKFMFQITLGESQVREPEPLTETLRHFVDLVESTVTALSIYL